MRYWALGNGHKNREPVGLMRFDRETLTPAYFSAKTQEWVPDGELFSVVMHTDSEPAWEVDEAEAERIRTTVLNVDRTGSSQSEA